MATVCVLNSLFSELEKTGHGRQFKHQWIKIIFMILDFFNPYVRLGTDNKNPATEPKTLPRTIFLIQRIMIL
jgi:hypothetical protein